MSMLVELLKTGWIILFKKKLHSNMEKMTDVGYYNYDVN